MKEITLDLGIMCHWCFSNQQVHVILCRINWCGCSRNRNDFRRSSSIRHVTVASVTYSDILTVFNMCQHSLSCDSYIGICYATVTCHTLYLIRQHSSCQSSTCHMQWHAVFNTSAFYMRQSHLSHTITHCNDTLYSTCQHSSCDTHICHRYVMWQTHLSQTVTWLQETAFAHFVMSLVDVVDDDIVPQFNE